MSEDLFNLDVLKEDDQTERDGRTVVGAIIRLVLAVSTAGYFYTYGSALFTWLVGPGLSPWVSAVVGTFFIDFMAYKWDAMRKKKTNTGTQIKTGKWMTVVDLALSVAITFVFAMLVGGFVIIGEEWVGLIRGIGFIVGMGAICGNAVAWVYFEANSMASKEAIEAAELTSTIFQGKSAIRKAEAKAVVGSTLKAVGSHMPEYSQQTGHLNSQAYYNERERQASVNGSDRPTKRE